MSKFVVTSISGFEEQAKQELKDALPGTKIRKTFLKGVLWLDSTLEEEDAVKRIGEAHTHYVARVIPVQEEIRISKGKEALEQLVEEVARLQNLPLASDSFRVDCERRGEHEFNSQEVARTVGMSLETKGAVFDFNNPQKIISIQIFQNIAFIGSSHAAHFLNKKPAQARKFEPGERPFTRAYYKLKEAFETFQLPAGGIAMDIGAAPGGWTKALLEKGFKAWAVDPAALEPEIEKDARVTHLKMRAEELLSQQLPVFDLLTFDANIPPEEAARLCNQLAKFLKPSGSLVLTFKRVEPGREVIDKGLEVLRESFEIKSVKRLRHNKRELTIAAIKAG